mgnify:CR=1 FL=1
MSKIHTNKTIAKRLDISTRQVSRILKKHNASKEDHENRNRSMDRETEDVVMSVQKTVFGMSLADIGKYSGLTRQAVHQRLSTE